MVLICLLTCLYVKKDLDYRARKPGKKCTLLTFFILKNTGLMRAAIMHAKLLTNNDNIKSKILRFRVLRSGDPYLNNTIRLFHQIRQI